IPRESLRRAAAALRAPIRPRIIPTGYHHGPAVLTRPRGCLGLAMTATLTPRRTPGANLHLTAKIPRIYAAANTWCNGLLAHHEVWACTRQLGGALPHCMAFATIFPSND